MSGTAHIKEIKKGYIKAIASTNNLGTLKPLRVIKKKLKRTKKKFSSQISDMKTYNFRIIM